MRSKFKIEIMRVNRAAMVFYSEKNSAGKDRWVIYTTVVSNLY